MFNGRRVLCPRARPPPPAIRPRERSSRLSIGAGLLVPRPAHARQRVRRLQALEQGPQRRRGQRRLARRVPVARPRDRPVPGCRVCRRRR